MSGQIMMQGSARQTFSPRGGLVKTLAKMLLAVTLLIAGLVALLLYNADSVLFQPHPSSYRDNAEILKITSANGSKISAMYLFNPAARFTLLVSHGNAEDIGDDRDSNEEMRHAGFSVLAYDYQGYGTSQGKPGEQTAYEDEVAAYDFLTTHLQVAPERIILLGRSVGSGPAVHLAARKPVAGMVLVSPFLSAFRTLTRVPLLPFDRFPNYKDIRRVHCPLLIVHGTRDTIIGFWHGQKLYELANQPKQFLPVEGAGHNDLEMVAGPVYFNALRDFAASIQGRAFASDKR
ncbi:MAG TPA: alpha/beta hydrolase [Candidatus Angelobacter sp.]